MRPIKIVLFLTVAFLLVACAIKPVPEKAGPGYQLFSQAEKMLQAKSYEKALELFKEYYERFPDAPLADAALMKMASIHATLGDFEQARSIIHDKYFKSANIQEVLLYPTPDLKYLSCIIIKENMASLSNRQRNF